MKVLYIHQYFLTPSQGGPLRSYFLAKTLVNNGCEVEMVTAYNGKQYVCKNIDGIKVHYLPVYYDNRLGFFSRVIAFIKFIYKAYNVSKSIQNINYCYITSTPLTVGVIGLLLKKYRGIPYYFEVRDLWPEAPIQLGVIKNNIVKKLLFRLEKYIYSNAESVIALSPGIKNSILKVAPEKSVIVIPNMSDCNFFNPDFVGRQKDEGLVDKYNVSGKFVITYFGAVGRVNQLSYMLDVVRICKEKGLNDIFFIIAGKGAEMQNIQRSAQRSALDNLKFLDFLNRENLKELLNISDAVFISFAKIPVIKSSSPNKFFDAIASGSLCIVNFQGWIKELIEDNRCGFYYDPEKPEEFIKKITPFRNSELLLQGRNNARKLAESKFSREMLTKRFLRLFITNTKIPVNANPAFGGTNKRLAPDLVLQADSSL
ncbi:MAG: glycosyltransferase family 4 protein [Bacteroidetes bacterium]|nr:glycosyltransferase family 4 protein [Bacteroidota bacterium]